ncbi:MAG TPA: metalloregulator ArsR/SmtB family transcription factor [Chryseolinea sp.]|nr:metalloregulator ArsR/SmtB family transcription factor [Chryseolinea sp.]
MMRRDVFQAIADPTRRKILNMIANKSLSINSVAGNFLVTRTAIYKHMKILSECGLIVIKQQGRERYCEARLKKLIQVSNWVEQYRQIWDTRFCTMEEYLSKMKSKRKKNIGRS